MYQQTTWPVSPAVPPFRQAGQPVGGTVLPSWLTGGLLLLASGVSFALAVASAWLSYHAQVSYVLAHNGNQAAQAHCEKQAAQRNAAGDGHGAGAPLGVSLARVAAGSYNGRVGRGASSDLENAPGTR